MAREPDYSDILVTVAHPFGDVEVPLDTWIARGPGPRPLVRPVSARSKGSGERLPLSVIPLQYRNNGLSRTLIAMGLLRDPWHS